MPTVRFGIVGLGRIGGSLARQALEKGHEVVGFDVTPEPGEALAAHGLVQADTLDALSAAMPRPRVVMVYVPHGEATEAALAELTRVLDEGDVVVDGGNSHWRESRQHHEELAEAGIRFVDCGTSGGVEGARHGACFMVGGDADAVAVVRPLLTDLAVPGGFVHAGPPGSGHFVKLIHNAIEFGMVQSIAEGVEFLESFDEDLDLPALFRAWSNGSVIRSWLVELTARALQEGPPLDALSPVLEDTKEGKWYVEYAVEKEVDAPVLTLSEMMFYRYRNVDSRAGKAVALIRNAFGGHPIPYKEEHARDAAAARHAEH